MDGIAVDRQFMTLFLQYFRAAYIRDLDMNQIITKGKRQFPTTLNRIISRLNKYVNMVLNVYRNHKAY